jgi:hypothetical protein
MPKILVENLPVKTYVNAEIEIEDGPDHTLQQRIEAAARAGRWERAGGRHEETYEDLDLEVDDDALDSPVWSFDIMAGGPAAPGTPSSDRGPGHVFFEIARGSLPTREQFDEAWAGTAHLLRHGDGPTVQLGGRTLGAEGAWAELVRLHGLGPDGQEECEYLLEVLGFDVGETP